MLQSSAMGYGNVSQNLIREGLKQNPDIIVGQGTSTDPGPGYLGSDEIFGYVGKLNKKRDIGLILEGAVEKSIPFIFSGGSPSGSNVQLEGVLRIVNEISKEKNYRLKIAVISGEIEKRYLKKKISEGVKVERLVNTERLPRFLTNDEVDQSKRIVAQMGPEPIITALQMNVDGVITGRALDIGLHMAYPMLKGFEKGLVAHMAKTIECGALCADPPINENIFAILRKDHFLVFPPNPEKRCTIRSVASHAFYERPDISRELNPGGYLDISEAKYEQFDNRTVKVSKGKWVPMPYTIKIEGVKLAGHRTITIAGVRDQNLIGQIDWFLEDIRKRTVEKFKNEREYQLVFHVYGKDGILGVSEPEHIIKGNELCVVVDIIAPDPDLSQGICAFVRGRMFFNDYPGRTSTAGNVATLFSPADVSMGESYTWNIWHSLPLDNPLEPFEVRLIKFPNSNTTQWE